MNITVYLGANEGNDPALKQAVQELENILRCLKIGGCTAAPAAV